MENYYQNTEYVSNSMLGWLKVSPRYFIKKVNKEEEVNEESSSMELGSMIHLALLEPDKFTVSSVDKPTGKMGVYCDALIQGKTKEEAKEIATFSYKQETLDKKFEGLPATYVEERLANKDKIFLDSRTKFLVDKCVDSILNSTESFKLLNEENSENELELYWEKDGIKKKGKVDKLILSELDNGVVFNVDVKTTSSHIYQVPSKIKETPTYKVWDDFEIKGNSYMGSFIKYGYYRQLAMYDEGIKAYIKEKYDKDVEVIHLHVVVNTTSFESIVYKFTDYWIELGKRELHELLEKYRWHKETNYWDTPEEFVDGIVKI